MRNFRAAKDGIQNTAPEKMSLTRKNLNFRKQKPIKTFKTKEPGLQYLFTFPKSFIGNCRQGVPPF